MPAPRRIRARLERVDERRRRPDQARARGVVDQDPIVRRRARPREPSGRSSRTPDGSRRRSRSRAGPSRAAASRRQRVSSAASTTTMPSMRGSRSKRRSDHSRTVAPASGAYCLGTLPAADASNRSPRPAAGTTAQTRRLIAGGHWCAGGDGGGGRGGAAALPARASRFDRRSRCCPPSRTRCARAPRAR